MPRIARFWDTLPRFEHQIRRKSQTDLAGSEESYLYWPRFRSHCIGGGGNSVAADAYKSTHIVAFAMIRDDPGAYVKQFEVTQKNLDRQIPSRTFAERPN